MAQQNTDILQWLNRTQIYYNGLTEQICYNIQYPRSIFCTTIHGNNNNSFFNRWFHSASISVDFNLLKSPEWFYLKGFMNQLVYESVCPVQQVTGQVHDSWHQPDA
ncbi:hypothetical protein BsWGS_12140 [Bradybaena similaris]